MDLHLDRIVHATDRPCDRCVMRTDRLATPLQRATLKTATERDEPYVCRQAAPGPDGRLKVCAGWLVTAWRHSRWAVAAVQERRLMLAELRPADGWPALHASVRAVVDVVLPRQKRRRLRLRVPFRAARG